MYIYMHLCVVVTLVTPMLRRGNLVALGLNMLYERYESSNLVRSVIRQQQAHSSSKTALPLIRQQQVHGRNKTVIRQHR